MGRKPADVLTRREAEVMDAVWALGAATAEQVRGAVSAELHDSTIRTLLRTLESKGFLRHESRGKAFVYTAAVPREKVQRSVLWNLVSRFFGGSAHDLVVRLIEDEKITPAELELLRQRALDAATNPPKRTRRSPKRAGD